MKFDLYYVVKSKFNPLDDRYEHEFVSGPFGTYDKACDSKRMMDKPYNYDIVWNTQTTMRI